MKERWSDRPIALQASLLIMNCSLLNPETYHVDDADQKFLLTDEVTL